MLCYMKMLVSSNCIEGKLYYRSKVSWLCWSEKSLTMTCVVSVTLLLSFLERTMCLSHGCMSWLRVIGTCKLENTRQRNTYSVSIIINFYSKRFCRCQLFSCFMSPERHTQFSILQHFNREFYNNIWKKNSNHPSFSTRLL